MSDQPPPYFDITVDDLLIMPEIQEVLKTDTSEETVSTTTSMISYTSSPSVVIPDGIGEPDSGDNEETKLYSVPEQEENKPLGLNQQIRRSRSSSLSGTTTMAEPESNTPHLSDGPMVCDGLPSDQHVHVFTSAEFDAFRCKVQAQTASLRRKKLQKDEDCQQKHRTRELKVELKRLQQTEAQLKEYEQRSVDSLQTELQMLNQEVIDLSEQVHDAAQEELDWVAEAVVSLFE